MAEQLDIVRGTLDLMILKSLSWTPKHGLAIVRWIERTSNAQLLVEEGALYPALHRMEQKKWLECGVAVHGAGTQGEVLPRHGRW